MKRFLPRTRQEATLLFFILVVGQYSVWFFGWPWHVAQVLFALVADHAVSLVVSSVVIVGAVVAVNGCYHLWRAVDAAAKRERQRTNDRLAGGNEGSEA